MEYVCPLAQSHPHKIYFVLRNICHVGDRYDDEFCTKFGAERCYEPRVTPYSAEECARIVEAIRATCRETLDAVKEYDAERKYGYSWNVIDTAFYKISYFAQPQGQLSNDLDKAVDDMDRELPVAELVAKGRAFLEKLLATPGEQLAADLYFVDTLVSTKRRSSLANVQENMKDLYQEATEAIEAENYERSVVRILYKFYEMYFYNDVQDDINTVVARALKQSAGKPMEEASEILYAALEKLMDDDLEEDGPDFFLRSRRPRRRDGGGRRGADRPDAADGGGDAVAGGPDAGRHAGRHGARRHGRIHAAGDGVPAEDDGAGAQGSAINRQKQAHTMENNIFQSIFKVTHSGGSGSCFYLKSRDLFVTNYHVVEGYRTVAIHDNDRNPYLAHVVVVNPLLDIALLAAEGDFTALPEIPLADDETVSVGRKIYVAGYPYGMPFTITEGSVSAPRQLMEGQYYLQTDAAVNPGNSGGPMLNDRNEVVGVTVSKFTQADNMGFGIRVETLRKLLDSLGEVDRTQFQVQCGSCDELIAEEEEFCPSCGDKLPEGAFDEREESPLCGFVESAIREMGIDPVLARDGYDSWLFHKGSSEIRIFVYDGAYLFSTSPINLLPKKEVEPVLDYMLSEDFGPYKLGIEGRQIYIAYRIHLSDITDASEEEIRRNIVNLALKADEMDNMMVERFGCEFSEYSKADAR